MKVRHFVGLPKRHATKANSDAKTVIAFMPAGNAMGTMIAWTVPMNMQIAVSLTD
jgi:hypothetical protein